MMKPQIIGEWTVLRLPAIQEDGTALWEEKFSIEKLIKIRERFGEKMFGGIFQQTPMDIIGRLFGNPQFADTDEDIKNVGYWDPAFKKEQKRKDYNAFAAGGIGSDNLFYLKAGDIWRADLRETYDRIEKLYFSLGLTILYVETNQGQDALIIELQNRGINAKSVYSSEPKQFRIENYAKLNWDKIRFGVRVTQEFIRQILGYSELAKHDDAPDCLAGLLKILGFGVRAKSIKNRLSFFDLLLGGEW